MYLVDQCKALGIDLEKHEKISEPLGEPSPRVSQETIIAILGNEPSVASCVKWDEGWKKWADQRNVEKRPIGVDLINERLGLQNYCKTLGAKFVE